MKIQEEEETEEEKTSLTQIRVSLGRSIKFSNLADVEACHKLGPDLRSQSIAKHHPDLVLRVSRFCWGRQDESANFANVLGNLSAEKEADYEYAVLKAVCRHFRPHRAVVLDAVGEEVGRGKLFPKGSRQSAQQDASDANHSAGGVVQRQGVVDDIVVTKAHHVVATGAHHDESGRNDEDFDVLVPKRIVSYLLLIRSLIP